MSGVNGTFVFGDMVELEAVTICQEQPKIFAKTEMYSNMLQHF